ncbi:hypothetical protein F2Q69_00040170 [Brassica cretica]|uniref:Uncharacterized protein n=1 Tax=Brassica cretica TaxID=69181 RepID=A0A8S9NLB2_BRACR|nr:hypothetical protein F2Q69_00040170 [Brassica cretica]
MDPSVLGGRSPGVSQQAPLSVLRGGSATSPIYISSGESYSSSSGESDSSADVSQPKPVVGGSQQNRYRPLSYGSTMDPLPMFRTWTDARDLYIPIPYQHFLHRRHDFSHAHLGYRDSPLSGPS